jgi:hypothetical protein
VNHEVATPHSPNDSVRTVVALDGNYRIGLFLEASLSVQTSIGLTDNCRKEQCPGVKKPGQGPAKAEEGPLGYHPTCPSEGQPRMAKSTMR